MLTILAINYYNQNQLFLVGEAEPEQVVTTMTAGLQWQEPKEAANQPGCESRKLGM